MYFLYIKIYYNRWLICNVCFVSGFIGINYTESPIMVHGRKCFRSHYSVYHIEYDFVRGRAKPSQPTICGRDASYMARYWCESVCECVLELK